MAIRRLYWILLAVTVTDRPRACVGESVSTVNITFSQCPRVAIPLTAALGIVDLRVITNRTNGEGVSRSNFNSSSNSADLDLSTGGQGGWMA